MTESRSLPERFDELDRKIAELRSLLRGDLPAIIHPLTPEEELVQEILAELTRARTKFPGYNVTTLALVEEVGELATAVFSEEAARVRSEAVQVAVMAMRVVLDGDRTLDEWRIRKGLGILHGDAET